MRRLVGIVFVLLGCSDVDLPAVPEAGGSPTAAQRAEGQSTAGATATGGAPSSGGARVLPATATGGAIATGGSVATGGATVATGGAATGGVAATGGAATGGAATGGQAPVCLPNVTPPPVPCQYRPSDTKLCADQPCGRTLCIVESNDPTYLGFCDTVSVCEIMGGKVLTSLPGICLVN